MLNPFRHIVKEIQAAFATPDPMRYSTPAPWNWNGEFEAKPEPKGGAILVNKTTQTFEFGQYANVKIEDYLTSIDIQELKARDLSPDNPAYAKCKRYFSVNPYCNKYELAAESAGDEGLGEYFKGIKPNTAEKVLAAFRAYIEDKPTF